MCDLQKAKEENLYLVLDGVRAIFLAAETDRSCSAVSILLHLQVEVFCPDPEPVSPIKSKQRSSVLTYFWVQKCLSD